MVQKLITKVLASTAALWVADWLISGVAVSGGWVRGYLFAGLLLGALSVFVKPILKLLSLPLVILTLGLFTLIINAGMLWITATALDTITFSGILPLLWTTLIVSAFHMLFNSSTNE